MNDLKNRGFFNPGFLVALAFVFSGIVYSFFEKHNAINDAPLASKIAGVLLGIWTAVFAFKSNSWLDRIQNDRMKLFAQIALTFLFALISILVITNTLGSEPLGTTTNPIKYE